VPTFVDFVFNRHKEKLGFNDSTENANNCFFVSHKLHVCLKSGQLSLKKSRRWSRTDQKAVHHLLEQHNQ